MTIEEWVVHELEALNKFELVTLLIDFACVEDPTLENLADYVDNWHRHT